LEAGHQRSSSLRHTERRRNLADIPPDISQCVRLQRDDAWSGGEPAGERALDVLQAHRTDLALRLRQNDVWVERLQRLVVDAVDGEGLAEDGLDLMVDLRTRHAGID
jgi:hypothetical protein